MMSTGSTSNANRSHFRTKSIGVRVTEADFARLQALADAEQKSLGEWSRDVLLEKAEGRNIASVDQAVLSELLALRRIVLNVLFSLASGKTFTTGEMDDLIQSADAEKLSKARERLRAVMREELGGSGNDD
jgi:hypothetical protein